MANAYISCPMTVSQSDLDKVLRLVQSYGVTPRYWVKGTPYDNDFFRKTIVNADAFIVILPNIAWKCEGNKMTSGSRRELSLAIALRKSIYLAYQGISTEMKIYSADVDAKVFYQGDNATETFITSISGIASTRFNFKELVGDKNRVKQLTASDILQAYEQTQNLMLQKQQEVMFDGLIKASDKESDSYKRFKEHNKHLMLHENLAVEGAKCPENTEPILDQRILLFF